MNFYFIYLWFKTILTLFMAMHCCYQWYKVFPILPIFLESRLETSSLWKNNERTVSTKRIKGTLSWISIFIIYYIVTPWISHRYLLHISLELRSKLGQISYCLEEFPFVWNSCEKKIDKSKTRKTIHTFDISPFGNLLHS